MLTKTKRRIIFYSLILVFLLAGTGVVFYAQGYRLNIQTFKIQKIGAIYIRTYPADAQVLLDKKPVARPFSIFESGILLSDLFPKTYLLTAKREGYKTWETHVSIEPSMVVEFKRAVMIPDVPEKITTSSESLIDFWVIGDDVVRKNTKNQLLWHDQKFPGTDVIGWTNDNTLLVTNDEKTNTQYRIDLRTGSSTSLTALLRLNGFRGGSTLLDPQDNTHVLVKTNRSLALVPLDGTPAIPLATAAGGHIILTPVASSPSRIAWIEFDPQHNTSALFIFNKATQSIEATQKQIAGETTHLLWSANDLLGILEDNGNLYLYNPVSGISASRANDVKDFAFSSNGSLLAALEHHSLEVFSFDSTDYWRFNIPEAQDTQRLSWYRDRTHLIVHYSDKTALLSLEDLTLENMQTITTNQNNIYDEKNNQFYFLSAGSIFRLNFPR